MAVISPRPAAAPAAASSAAARTDAAGGGHPPERFAALRSARTRIVLSFLVLLIVSAVGSLVLIRQAMIVRLEDRIADSLRQEVLELDRLLADGRDPETGRAFSSLASFFEVYFARNVPGNEEALIAFVGGRFERQSLARFPLPDIPPGIVARWESLSSSLSPDRVEDDTTGRFRTPQGTVHYRVSPVRYDDGTGAFVVAILPAAELREIRDLQTYGTVVTLLVLLLAAGCTWFVAGRALAPVRQLTLTAQAISQSDLASRIEVRGSDEAAEMARSFNAMLDRLEGVFRDERQFVRDASHELRDPLTICLGYLRQLENAPAEERAAMQEVVTGELTRMARIVGDLQGLAEAQHPDFLRLETIDLDLLAHELVAKAAGLGPRRWTLLGGDPGLLVADRDRLIEAVMNLARNAVEQTREGDEIAIGVMVDGDRVRLSVRDDGDGIPEAEREAIFDRFVRGEGGRRRYRGSGLGLPIVRLIAEAHRGRVEVRSRVGRGATFTIILPVDGPPEEAA